MTKYEAYTYPADGHGEPSATVCEGSLEECREAAIAALLPQWDHIRPLT